LERRRQVREKSDQIYWKEFNKLLESVPMERLEKGLREYYKKHGHL